MQTLTDTTREILLSSYEHSISEIEKMLKRLKKISKDHEFYQAMIIDIALEKSKVQVIKDMLIKGQFEF